MNYDRFRQVIIVAVKALPLTAGLVVCHSAATQERVPGDVFVSTLVEVYQRTKYPHLSRQKAIAIGPAGVFGVSWRKYSAARAGEDAIVRCQQRLQRSRFSQLHKRRCHLYAENEKVVFRGRFPELPLGTSLRGNDLPMKKAIYDRSPKIGVRGIVLALHGCSRVRRLPKWVKQWLSYFRAQKFRVIMPNSFAEKRPPQQCDRRKRGRLSRPSLRQLEFIDRVKRIRTAQTYRTLGSLNDKYPALPVIIWGHSEGGRIAQYISVKVAGILTSGVECGFRGIHRILVKPTVPVLALIGSKDFAIRRPTRLTRENVSEYCANVFRSPLWEFEYLEGVDHYPSIKNRTVRQSVDKFIKLSHDLHTP